MVWNCLPGGIYNVYPGIGYGRAPRWEDADVYSFNGVVSPAHPSPCNTGMEAYSLISSGYNDYMSDVNFSNLLFAVSLDNTIGHTNNMMNLSQWYF